MKVVELKEKYHSMQPGKTLDFNAFVGFCWVVHSVLKCKFYRNILSNALSFSLIVCFCLRAHLWKRFQITSL